MVAALLYHTLYLCSSTVYLSTLEWMDISGSFALHSNKGGVEDVPTNEKYSVTDLIPVSSNQYNEVCCYCNVLTPLLISALH